MQEEKNLIQPHQLILEERSRLSVTGVQDVDCFDETVVILFTSLGKLVIRGRGLRVEGFSTDTGDFSLDGPGCDLRRDHGVCALDQHLLHFAKARRRCV